MFSVQEKRTSSPLRLKTSNSVEEKPKSNFISRGPFTNAALKNDIQTTNSSHVLDKNYAFVSKTRFSVSSESPEDDSSNKLGDTKTEESIGIVKTILGPSFEDAVLRTLEFGKSLIQKSETSDAKVRGKPKTKEKRRHKKHGRGSGEGDKPERRAHKKEGKEGRSGRKRIVYMQNEKVVPSMRKVVDPSTARPLNLAKIRSLDSELKQVAPSPEKIKRQLEALIQINKDEPPECLGTWGCIYPKDLKPLKTHFEYTVMPTTVRQTCCPLSKEEDCCCGSKCTATGTCCEGSKARSRTEEGEGSTSSRFRGNSVDDRSIRSAPNPMRQAPEYLANALGPTLDVSIMDNLKLMRNLFKCEKSEPDERGEPQPGSTVDVEESKNGTEDEETYLTRVEELQRRVDELTEKQMRLLKEIEEEEQEREAKRKAFEEEEKKLQSVKASLLEMAEEERVRESHKRQSVTECRDYEQKFEALKCRIRSEEERLNSLKEQNDSYMMEINETKRRKENLKKNKSLLDAWDVFASRVCHTRLPSFSRAQCLERKSLKPPKEPQHCCFPQASAEKLDEEGCSGSRSRSLDFRPVKVCKHDGDQIPYPLQRDIVCGMHRIVKTCLCNEPLSKETASWSSDDELRKSSRKSQQLQRSKSEMGRKEHSARLCKVLWAVTRINIFQDNSRTYEVMDATTVPPKYPPVKTEGVFVVKNPKKCCPEPQKKDS